MSRLTRLFAPLTIADDAIVQLQGPFRATDLSRPQPDLALLRYRSDFYAEGLGRPADVLLLIEVSDSSLRFDRTAKRPAYARAGVVETWIVDVADGVVEVAREPTPTGYGAITAHARGDAIAPLAFPELRLAVTEIVG